MPAVLLSRLDQQIKASLSTFDRPNVFVANLVSILELYSDRTYQAGIEVPSSSKILSYRVPDVVIRSLELELRHLATKHAEEALHVADELWSGNRLDLKELGIALLGFIPVESSLQVMERIEIWAPDCLDGFLLEDLLARSSPVILHEIPSLWLDKLRGWLNSNDSKFKILGLKSIEPLLKTEDFNDLPQLLDSIHSMVVNFTVDLFPEMFHLFQILVERYPIETVAYLKHVIAENPGSSTFRLVRRILPSLTAPMQLSLRTAMETPEIRSLPFIESPALDRKKPVRKTTKTKPKSSSF